MSAAVVLRIAAVLCSVAGMLWGADRLGRRLALTGEVRRKLLHFGTGILGLTFPWLFDSFAPVAVVCAFGLGAAAWLRRGSDIGDSLHGVARRSLGDFLFPLAIAGLWLLAQGDPILYLAPLLVLTAADGSAALTAIRYGLSPYPTLDGTKTWEGTVVFCMVAFVATLVPLQLLSTVGRAEVLLVAGVVALVACLIEAASWFGLDNLFIPLGTHFALRRCVGMGAGELAIELTVLLLLAIAAFVGARRARLTVQARFCVMVAGFWVFDLGGAAWLLPGVAVLLLHPLLVRLPRSLGAASVDLRAVLSVASAAVLWLVLDRVLSGRATESLYAYCVALATHLVMTADLRRHAAGDVRVDVALRARWSAIATLGILGCYLLFAGSTLHGVLVAALAWPLLWTVSWLFGRCSLPRYTTRCWALQGALAIATSLIAFLGLTEVLP